MQDTSPGPVERLSDSTPRTRTVRGTGAPGLLGEAVAAACRSSGGRVAPLRRGTDWDPTGGAGGGGGVTAGRLRDTDAVLHLAGEPIVGRWTAAKKRRIRDSRVEGTRAIAEACVRDGVPVLLSGSAVGFYGDRGDAVLTEADAAGAGFFSEVCRAWEDAARPAVAGGVRVAWLRTGIVLSERGGALKQMLTPFRLGLGGRIGRGRQYWPWIGVDDWVGAVTHLLNDATAAGAFNLTGPEPVTNAAFTKALGRALRRPTVLPLPGFAARLALGEMADEALLASQRVVPRALESAGFAFEQRTIDDAMRAALASR